MTHLSLNEEECEIIDKLKPKLYSKAVKIYNFEALVHDKQSEQEEVMWKYKTIKSIVSTC